MENFDYRMYSHFRGFYTTFSHEDQQNVEGVRYLFRHALSVWDSLPEALPDLADLNGDLTDPEIMYALNNPSEWHLKSESSLYTALLTYRASFYRAQDNAPLHYVITPYYSAMQNAGYTKGLEYKL